MKKYDSGEETVKSRRHLPHWQQPGCTYFITFRLHDSIPQAKLGAWNEERGRWLRSQNLDTSLPWNDILAQLDPGQKRVYYDTFWKKYHDMLDDGHGACELRDPANARIVADALFHFDGQRYRMGDFVVMPNHVHLLVTPHDGHMLENLLHSWKRFTAREINKRMEQSGQLWQHESYDHIVRNESQLQRIQKYIKNNPRTLPEGTFFHHKSRTSL